MQIGFKIVCLIIVSLCDHGHGHQWAPLVDSRMSFRIPKSIGLDWNDPREGHVNVTGKDPLLGVTIIPDIERQYHRFLLRYYLGC